MPAKKTDTRKRFLSYVEFIPESSCYHWVGRTFGKNPYGAFWLDGNNCLAHRVAWELRFGKILKGLCVCHTCDNPKCVRTEHMFLGTIAENNADKQRKNRQAKGERMAAAKLTEKEVLEIRETYATGEIGQVDLGSRYGVGHTTISYIVNRKYWKHI